MNQLLTLLFFMSFQDNSYLIKAQTSPASGRIEFIDSYPVKIDGEASFFTFDTTSLEKQKYVFIVSGSRTAFFKKSGKYILANGEKRQKTQNGYVDRFNGNGYHITLDVTRDKKISEGRTRYTGTLKIAQKDKVINITVQGINEEYKLNFIR